MKIYDYLVIGAGSAGCNIAHILEKKSVKVLVVDKEGIAGSASGAAGAFLSPLPGKQNLYNSFVNDALEFSLKFYENLLINGINKKGVLRVPTDNFNDEKLKNNHLSYKYFSSQYLQKISSNFKHINGYFYENASIIEPKLVCEKLLLKCDFIKKDIKSLNYIDGYYLFDNFKAKNIVLTQGVSPSLLKLPYMNISPIFGLKIDVKTTTKIPFNIHKNISISTNKSDGTVSIGATSQRHDLQNMKCETTCDKCEFYINTDEAQISTLLTQANELIKLDDVEVVKVYKGARASIKSYFPVVGKAINYDLSLSKYPSIKKGATLKPELLSYHENIFIMNALGSRGFVFAPYLAKILSEHILKNKEIPKELSLEKLFYKLARKKI
jgi:glycine/D-amino acid oxidase-like deaminating enzyme